MSHGDKDGPYVELLTLPPSCADFLGSSCSPQGPVPTCVGLDVPLVLHLNYMTKIELHVPVSRNKLRRYSFKRVVRT